MTFYTCQFRNATDGPIIGLGYYALEFDGAPRILIVDGIAFEKTWQADTRVVYRYASSKNISLPDDLKKILTDANLGDFQ